MRLGGGVEEEWRRIVNDWVHGWYDLIGDNRFASQIQGQILNMHDGGRVELQHAIAILLEDVLHEYACSCDCMVCTDLSPQVLLLWTHA